MHVCVYVCFGVCVCACACMCSAMYVLWRCQRCRVTEQRCVLAAIMAPSQAIGFSGHHLGIAIDIAAYALGAEWNERHFTKDRSVPAPFGGDTSKFRCPDLARFCARSDRAGAHAWSGHRSAHRATIGLPFRGNTCASVLRLTCAGAPTQARAGLFSAHQCCTASPQQRVCRLDRS